MDWSTQFRLIGRPRFDLQVSFLEDSASMWLVYNQLCFGCCFSGAANIIHVLICKWAFSRIARQCGWCIISFALVAVSLELPISSRYTCCWSSFAASGNSACDSFSGLIDGVRCSVREHVYHQSLIWAMDKHLVDHLSYSSIETCHAFDRRYAIGFG